MASMSDQEKARRARAMWERDMRRRGLPMHGSDSVEKGTAEELMQSDPDGAVHRSIGIPLWRLDGERDG